jgi:Family of unknown function (DUF5824)
MKRITIKNYKVPIRYVPTILSKRDTIKQKQYIDRSRKAYRHGKYFLRPKIKSFTGKKSSHVANATKLYGVPTMKPGIDLERATKCKRWALKKIINKGRGAYYSSGSRPNQTPDSWGYARLASALTGGPSSQIDYHILEKGCSKGSNALQLANKTRKRNAL